MRRVVLPALLALSALALVACGDDSEGASSTSPSTAPPTTAPAETVEVFRYEAIGGCQMMGPNCATYVIYSDGSVEVYRTGENAPAELTGTLPDGLIDAFLAGAATIDFEEMAARVGPGTCNACVDGIDVVLTIELPTGEVQLDSTVVNFDPAEPFFLDVETLVADAAAATGELPIVSR